MNKKLFKITSWAALIIGGFFVFRMGSLSAISIFFADGGWKEMNIFLSIVLFIATAVLFLPFILAGINGLKQLKEGSNKTINKALFHNIAGILLLLWFLRSYVYRDSFRQFKIMTPEKYEVAILNYTLIVCILILPLGINVIELIKEKTGIETNHENRISKEIREKIGKVFNVFRYVVYGLIAIIILFGIYKGIKLVTAKINEVSVTQYNTHTRSELINELRLRGLLNKKVDHVQKTIVGLDADNSYPYLGIDYDGADMFSEIPGKNYPMYIYASYISLIEKSSLTNEDYDIGPEDFYVEWTIYYVNGEIYATISNKSELDSINNYSLSKTIIVSEKKKITIYDQKNNVYHKNGGITDTTINKMGSIIPKMTSSCHNDCIKVKVVSRVDAETLDKIAKEIVLKRANK